MGQSNIIIAVPRWLRAVEAAQAGTFPSVEARVALAVELAQRNIDQGTGGPFGAAVFDLTTHTLVAAGVNLVTSAACSIAHAEMIALARAQQRLKTWDLSAVDRFELATSCAPCAMCLGAMPWSGVCALACGARDEDARAIGFDEGAKPADWAGELEKRGITVTQDILRERAAAVLRAYAAAGGKIY
ncbi:MAG: nucleoside deaminase [Phycisphaerae bacterium]|nr:nucleoside deaminase [Phycisphaerae bacterium]